MQSVKKSVKNHIRQTNSISFIPKKRSLYILSSSWTLVHIGSRNNVK